MVFKFLNIETLVNYKKGVQRIIDVPVQEKISKWVDSFNVFNSVASTSTQKFDDFYTTLDGNDLVIDYFKSIQDQGVGVKASMDGVYKSLIGETHGFKNAKAIISGYNKITDQTGKTQHNYANLVGESNTIFGEYLSSVKSGEASLLGYIGKLVATKAATIALNVATSLLSAGIGLIAYIIQLITKPVNILSKGSI